ncbi:L,D-transpeptidase family protein [Kitasatospora sp. MAP5-34]|uniref:L,D-transpeptidase family protein n=1 Tax=Kitasatospora sp. MAP5-34 TaxID=3035102 RepID=UPI002472F2C8|nr:L,D-transpeptidase family protein [Kitasatospora sp. MAP5-34]MDH6576182.1 L,D-peptidoglycan transpeptidase YkuD (ErfK/YbiS/YcfS/YnhG family) [Kitasatospora sp. MAP5-34]
MPHHADEPEPGRPAAMPTVVPTARPTVLAARAGATAVSGRRADPRRAPRTGATGRAKAGAGATAALVVVATAWFTFGTGVPRTPDAPVGALLHSRHGDLPQPVATPSAPVQLSTAEAGAAGAAADSARSERSERPADLLPGLGQALGSRIPADSNQVVLVSGQGRNSSDSTLTVWSRDSTGRWESLARWPAHNGFHGWTSHHTQGDLRSPIGLYTLGDAGGRLPDPGSRLAYHQDDSFEADGTGFAGEQLEGSFDYVIAIDYNRVTGTSPLDARRPRGSRRGGGIWLHVDHGGPTHGCVTVSQDHMIELLRILDPAAHPVIVMADAAALAA